MTLCPPPVGQRVRAGNHLCPPGRPRPVLPDLQRVETVAQRALLRHLPAQSGHQRPGWPLPVGCTSHDPHTLLHWNTCVRKRRQAKTEVTHTHTVYIVNKHCFTLAESSLLIPTLSTQSHNHTLTHRHMGAHIVRCVNIIEEAVWDMRVWIFDNPEDPTGCLLHVWTESINLPLSMEIGINSTSLLRKIGLKKGDFLSRLFLCILLILLFLILGRRGSYVAAIQRRILFTTTLYYFCTDKLCTQSHQFSPFLSLSFCFFLSLSHYISCWFTGTSLPVRAGNFWSKAVWKGSRKCCYLGWKRVSRPLKRQSCQLSGTLFQTVNWKKKTTTQLYLPKEAPRVHPESQGANSASLSCPSFPLSLCFCSSPSLFLIVPLFPLSLSL